MSDPQQPSGPGATPGFPPPAAPAQGFPPPAATAPRTATPDLTPASPGSAPSASPLSAPAPHAPPGAYLGPAGGYTAPFAAATPAAARPSLGLGLTALILSLLATVGASLAGGWAAFEIGRGVVDDEHLSSLSGSLLRILSPVRDIVLWAEISFWVGTLLGLTAFVLGIVATVRRNGRPMGIAAIVLATLGPAVFGAIVSMLLPLGAAAGSVGA
ncbi:MULTISPECIES: hypothetical protein [Bacteria]|uniref:hypothetical protein n=1 Tax=Bacteria TaxID=2 RepID=UPI003C79CEC6